MLTLEVHGQLITWPEDIAQMMIKFYLKRGVPCKVYSNSAPAGIDANTEGNAPQMHLHMGTS
jgi:hypothetical protein